MSETMVNEERLASIAGREASKGVQKTAPVTKQPAWVVWSAALTCLVSGVMCNTAVKIQNRESFPVCAEDDCESKIFDQPFWQTFIMFSGEAVCIIAWIIDSWLSSNKGKKHGIFEWPQGEDLTRRLAPFWWWGAPAVVDLTGTVLVNMAFGMTYVSTVQMLRNSILIMTSLMSMAMLRRPLRVHEWLGIIIMTGGMVASGVQAIIDPDDTSTVDSSKAWLGIVLTLCGTVFSAFQIILEEKMFQKAYCPPLRAVGFQGLFGMFINGIALIVCHYAGFYDFAEGWYQMNHSGVIMTGNFWYLVVVFIFNGSGLTTTFVGSGLLRGVIYSCRAPILFIIELILKWQSFSVGALLGLILSIIGFMFFAYLLPFLGKNRTPKFYTFLRNGVSCYCTLPLPPSDDEEDDHHSAPLHKGSNRHVYEAEEDSPI